MGILQEVPVAMRCSPQMTNSLWRNSTLIEYERLGFLAQLVRAPALYADGYQFDPDRIHIKH